MDGLPEHGASDPLICATFPDGTTFTTRLEYSGITDPDAAQDQIVKELTMFTLAAMARSLHQRVMLGRC